MKSVKAKRREMVVGFTGTRQGMTNSQYMTFKQVVGWLDEVSINSFHHGGCIGADKTAHHVVGNMWPRFVHRSSLPATWADCEGDNVYEFAPRLPLERNAEIVKVSDVLIACPKGFKEEIRSGTWATIRLARKTRKPVIIIWPNGKMEVQ